jgi:hypothetical protein
MHRPLTFEKQPARLVNFNPRAEKHGPERKPAGDVFLSLVVDRSVLAAFDPVLPQMLFHQHGEAHANPDEVAALDPRLPFLEALKWDQKYPGYGIDVSFGLELLPPIALDSMQLSDFVIEAQKGGTARLSFRASGHPTTEQSGELCALIQQDVIVSLIPPQEDAVAQEAHPSSAQDEMFLGDVAAPPKPNVDNVLVNAVDLHKKKNQLTEAVVTCSDGSTYRVGDWASDPTLDQVAGAMYDELALAVEYTPAAREAYDAKLAA